MRAEEIEELASVWLAREQGGLTSEEQQALEDWLAESNRNTVAYLRLKAVWERAGRLSALRAPMRPMSPQKSWWALLRIPAFAAIALALLYGGNAYLESNRRHEVAYSTGVGQTQAYRLADGTRMALNTNTRLRVEVTGKERTVTLESGEAFFEVAHDEHHPFTVYAGKRRITDIGTKFSVFLNGDNVRILVSEGRVRVETQAGAVGPSTPIVAGAGHEVIAQGMEALVFAKPDSEIARDLSWRNGMLIFDQLPLTEVAREFNRYNARHIVVEGNARKIRIGGTFKADNVDAFVLLLQQGFGLSVKNQGDKIVVSR